MGVDYPIAIDNEFAVWRAFGNQAWPALYFVDAAGANPASPLRRGGLRAVREGHSAAARRGGSGWGRQGSGLGRAQRRRARGRLEHAESPETYVGYARATGLASPGGVDPDRSRLYVEPPSLDLNQWSLSGDWTVGEQIATLNEPGGRITFRFHARDLNLVLGPEGDGRFRALPGADRRQAPEWRPGHRRRRAGNGSSPTRGSTSWSARAARSATAPSRSPSSIRAPRPTCSPSASGSRG